MEEYYFGLDVGGTKCATILASVSEDDRNRVDFLERDEFPTNKYDWKQLCSIFIDRFESYQVKYDVVPKAIGVSCGGPLDSRKGIIQSPPNLPGWDDVPIVDIFRDALGIPCYLENDANAGAMAEHMYGAGIGLDNIVFLTFGTGLGAGLILNGKLFCGASGMAGEIGHFRLAPNGPVGYFKNGSFEGFCSGGGIAQLGEQMLAAWDGETSLRSCDELNAKVIGDEADKGDGLSIEIYRNVGRHLGKGLSLVIDAFNPDMIIIGGIYAKSHHLMDAEMNRVLEEEALPQSLSVCRIVPSRLQSRIGDYAAIAIAVKGE